MKSTKIILLGSTGLVGSRLMESLNKKFNIDAPTRKTLDLTSDYQIDSYMDKNIPDVILYAAGIVGQDEAENNMELAKKINSTVVTKIAKRAKKIGSQVIYLSSDAVFSGTKDELKKENSKLNPVNFYGKTKAYGEDAVLSAQDSNTVVRLISVYSSLQEKKIDFARGVLQNLEEKKIAFGIVDQFFNPTYIDFVGGAIEKVIKNHIPGILHLGASDCISNYSFAQLLAERFGYNKNIIVAKSFTEFNQLKIARRGQFCCLDVNYSKQILGDTFYKTNKENINSFFLNFESKVK